MHTHSFFIIALSLFKIFHLCHSQRQQNYNLRIINKIEIVPLNSLNSFLAKYLHSRCNHNLFEITPKFIYNKYPTYTYTVILFSYSHEFWVECFLNHKTPSRKISILATFVLSMKDKNNYNWQRQQFICSRWTIYNTL